MRCRRLRLLARVAAALAPGCGSDSPRQPIADIESQLAASAPHLAGVQDGYGVRGADAGVTSPPAAWPGAKPTPTWSWDRLPMAYHGANRSAEFTERDLQRLARFSMVTIEKWYTPCGCRNADPSCDVEDKMYRAFRRLKQLNPQITNNLYLNTMFDFAFFRLHAEMLAMEARGQRAFLRDRDGRVVLQCNDGNLTCGHYCNVTTFDWTEPAVQQLWEGTVSPTLSSGREKTLRSGLTA